MREYRIITNGHKFRIQRRTHHIRESLQWTIYVRTGKIFEFDTKNKAQDWIKSRLDEQKYNDLEWTVVE